MDDNYIKGRGSQIKPDNPYLKASYSYEDFDGIDEPWLEGSPKTRIFYEYPKKIVNKVDSPDLGVMYSINPYQGCEHGCIYCYARNAHEYWGFGAGLDFETKIIVKPDAPRLLENFFLECPPYYVIRQYGLLSASGKEAEDYQKVAGGICQVSPPC